MKKTRILYIGTPHNYELWKEGKNPSHWLYGACEMEEDGHEVIWEQEQFGLFNDLYLLIQHKPDVIFIPNLNLQAHKLLLLLTATNVIHTPIYAYLHHTPKGSNGLKQLLYRLLLKGIKHLFFLSELTMKETTEKKYVQKDRCSVPGWGADEKFFSKIINHSSDTFVSTGKEQRDFDILIEAFTRTGTPLKIITCKNHAGNNFEDLPQRCKSILNIEVIITENSSDVYPQMVRAMADAKALVCPLRQDKLDYCVGLSTIADAEGLHKPLIITRNPYHSAERIRPFHVVNTIDDWTKAITEIQVSTKEYPALKYSMQQCYQKMRKAIFGN
ncbi:hypothetical protein OXB14_015905 [Bacteroides hominis]|uniref:hypothetical protein n=1 Tax=Bacteroides hominis TaxID=2763023 RepID=UPI002273F7C7|nr:MULTISPECIES: hypothetical protein [Bacteroides]MCY2671916.1 hypothetical protein [Bacteroides fragilis]MDA1494442.1 hypothetical protein [Bacteroides fragilis]MDV6133312.1 hypothetical protein [Bacteroides hominis (ex Liu et al. 2022)]MDV6151798.1 hypothetical protein [Bacteroides hominis (ex Liu et al. 2022)]